MRNDYVREFNIEKRAKEKMTWEMEETLLSADRGFPVCSFDVYHQEQQVFNMFQVAFDIFSVRWLLHKTETWSTEFPPF